MGPKNKSKGKNKGNADQGAKKEEEKPVAAVESVVEAVPEPVPVVEAVPEPVPVVEAVPEPVLEVEVKPEPAVEVESKPEPVADVESEPEVVAVTEAEPESVPESKPEPVPEEKVEKEEAKEVVEEVAAVVEEKVEEKLVEEKAEEVKPKTVAENCSTTDASDLQSVSEILKKLDLDSADFTTEQKLNALCLIFKETVAENVRLRESNVNLTDQMEKNEQTKAALTKLCQALRTQINLTKEQGEIKVREETQRRIEVSENFQKTMDELGSLMTTHSTTNTKLKEENALMSKQMHEILKQYEERQDKYANMSQEHKLQIELYEAKLNKAKLERAEMSTDFTKERLELHKSLVEAKEHIEILLKREDNMMEQIDLYKQQASELHAALTEMGGVASGTDTAQNRNFNHFRTEIDKLTKRLRGMERDTAEWKEKFEASNDQVRKMNAITMDREKEITVVKKKLAAMENLNRVLSKERNELLQKVKSVEVVAVAKAEENGNAV